MEQNNLNWVKGVEYGACGFIGSAFVVNGLSYLTPRSEYHVPRLLTPLFDLLGNVGLAIGLLLLGGALILYALNRWRRYVAGAGTFVVLIAFSVVVFLSINLWPEKPKEEIQQPVAEQTVEQEQIAKIQDMEMPEFSNTDVTLFFLSFESLLDRYRNHIETGNDQAIDRDYLSYTELTQAVPELLTTLSSDDKFRFAQYYAKLQIEWSDAARQ